jgi:hypothetical protein
MKSCRWPASPWGRATADWVGRACRAFFVCVYSIALDHAWMGALRGLHTQHAAWGAITGRIGLFGVMLPLALHLCGLILPLTHLSTYERHYSTIHKVSSYESTPRQL